MSTCRVSALNATDVQSPARVSAAPVPVLDPVPVIHAGYEWNKAGTRIRCSAEDCREVFEIPDAGDIQAADTIFGAHQHKVLGSIPVELAALRRLREAMPDVLSALAHGVPALRIEASLSMLVSETDAVIDDARGRTPDHPAPASEEPAPQEDPVPEPPAEPELEPAPEAPESEPEEASPQPREEQPAKDAVEPRQVDGLAAVKAGDRVLAVFSTAKQGVFEMEATVIDGIGSSQLVVGSWLLSSGGAPSAHLVDVTVIAPAGTHDKPVVPGSTAPEHFGTGI